MSTVDSVLFKLLAIGLGHDVSFDLPLGEIDWPALINSLAGFMKEPRNPWNAMTIPTVNEP